MYKRQALQRRNATGTPAGPNATSPLLDLLLNQGHEVLLEVFKKIVHPGCAFVLKRQWRKSIGLQYGLRLQQSGSFNLLMTATESGRFALFFAVLFEATLVPETPMAHLRSARAFLELAQRYFKELDGAEMHRVLGLRQQEASALAKRYPAHARQLQFRAQASKELLQALQAANTVQQAHSELTTH